MGSLENIKVRLCSLDFRLQRFNLGLKSLDKLGLSGCCCPLRLQAGFNNGMSHGENSLFLKTYLFLHDTTCVLGLQFLYSGFHFS